MTRGLVGLAAAAAIALVLVSSSGAGSSALRARIHCDDNAASCAEADINIGYGGTYVGHDEPSLLFYSNTSGSGNSNKYGITLPKDPPTQPNQQGTAATWNFQLHPALWLGMALCDTQSAPEFTHEPCKPDSDANIFDSAEPNSPKYIGKHPGTAFMEMQFYPPGWVPWPAGNSCDATKWCAALNIFSLNLDQNTGAANNEDCLNRVGLEPDNFAFITKSGVPHSSPAPLEVFSPPFAAFTPNPSTDLFMSSGDKLTVEMLDTADGFRVVIHDLTTGESGSMTASQGNGFAQIKFDPGASQCTELPYAFHPMYATSSEHTRVPWAAHSYNVAFSDEIGHFEYCSSADEATGQCLVAAGQDKEVDGDDVTCFNPADSTLVQIGGCLGSDDDYDGPSYQTVWPGTGGNQSMKPDPFTFASPLFNNSQNYDRIAFETDLPRIEAQPAGPCNRTTGEGCVNPPPGAQFYPVYTTGSSDTGCVWRIGGADLPNTTNKFGGNSAAEYGPLLKSTYPDVGGQPVFRFNNFRRVLDKNPCPAATQ